MDAMLFQQTEATQSEQHRVSRGCYAVPTNRGSTVRAAPGEPWMLCCSNKQRQQSEQHRVSRGCYAVPTNRGNTVRAALGEPWPHPLSAGCAFARKTLPTLGDITLHGRQTDNIWIAGKPRSTPFRQNTNLHAWPWSAPRYRL